MTVPPAHQPPAAAAAAPADTPRHADARLHSADVLLDLALAMHRGQPWPEHVAVSDAAFALHTLVAAYPPATTADDGNERPPQTDTHRVLQEFVYAWCRADQAHGIPALAPVAWALQTATGAELDLTALGHASAPSSATEAATAEPAHATGHDAATPCLRLPGRELQDALKRWLVGFEGPADCRPRAALTPDHAATPAPKEPLTP